MINIGSVGFENVYLLFNEDRITKKCAVISDLDTPINVGNAGENKAHKLGIERKRQSMIMLYKAVGLGDFLESTRLKLR